MKSKLIMICTFSLFFLVIVKTDIALSYGYYSIATKDAYGPILYSVSYTDLFEYPFITSLGVRADFFKLSPPSYNISTVWGDIANGLWGAWIMWYYFAPPTEGTHFVRGHHRFIWFGLFTYEYTSGPYGVHWP